MGKYDPETRLPWADSKNMALARFGAKNAQVAVRLSADEVVFCDAVVKHWEMTSRSRWFDYAMLSFLTRMSKEPSMENSQLAAAFKLWVPPKPTVKLEHFRAPATHVDSLKAVARAFSNAKVGTLMRFVLIKEGQNVLATPPKRRAEELRLRSLLAAEQFRRPAAPITTATEVIGYYAPTTPKKEE